MSLVRFSHTPDFLTDLKNKIRHLYDLHKMLEDDELNAFFESIEFEEMLHNVARNDYETLRNNKDWLKIHPNKAAIFLNLENI